jgi:hypothetical protein
VNTWTLIQFYSSCSSGPESEPAAPLPRPYTHSGLVDAGEAQPDQERMMDLFEARDVYGIIAMMRRRRGVTVEAVARWEARERS